MYEQTGDMDWKVANDVLNYYIQKANEGAGNGTPSGVTNPSDPKDAVALNNVLHALGFIDQGNVIRENEGLGTLKVSPILMAMSEAMANMSNETLNHWIFDGRWNADAMIAGVTSEVLAPGWGDDPDQVPMNPDGSPNEGSPYYGWYTEEKAVYEYCRDVLGMSESEITQKNVQNLPIETMQRILVDVFGYSESTVADWPRDNFLPFCQVGHYLTLVDPNATVTGYGVHHRREAFEAGGVDTGTSLQITGKYIKYDDGDVTHPFIDGKTFTTDEYRALLNQFIAYSNSAKETAKAALDAAKAELATAQQKLIAAEGDRTKALATVAEKQAAVESAQAHYESVAETAEDLIVEVENAFSLGSSSEEVVAHLNSTIDKLSTSIADDNATLATLDTIVETKAVADAETALRDAVNKVSTVTSEKVDLENALVEAEAKVEAKKAEVDSAQASLDELNQSLEQAIANLRVAQAAEALAQDEYDAALADHQTAMNTLSALSTALTHAHDAKDKAEQAKADALTAMNEAEATLEARTAERDALQVIVDQIVAARKAAADATAEVGKLTTKVTDLTSALTEAEKAHTSAVAGLQSATTDLASARAALHAAVSTADATGTAKAQAEAKYNKAVTALKNAEKALEEAKQAVPTVTDFVSLEKAVADAQDAVDKAETALAEANDAHAKALAAEKDARQALAEAQATYEEIEALSFKIDDKALANLDRATADKILESGKNITIKVTEDFIDYSKVGEGFTADNSTATITLNMKLVGASMKGAGSRSLTFDISPEVVFSNGTSIVKGELNDYLKKNGVKITVTLPMNGLDVKEVVHKHGTETDYIYEFTKDAAADTITFTVDQFSTFTLNETPANPAYGSTQNTGSKPVTDTMVGEDSNNINYAGLTAGFIATASLVSYCVLRRKCRIIED